MEPVPETRAAFRRLARYGDPDTAATVMELGQRARSIVPECVGLSLALIEDGITFTLVATDAECAALDAVQYLDGGPCVESVETAEELVVNAADALDEDRWQMYALAASAAGVASSLSLPILRAGAVIGGINLYGATPNAFDGRQQALAEALGSSAEAAVSNADLAFSSRLKAAEATDQLADRHDIDIAVGMVAARHHVDTARAEERLRNAAARAGVTEVQAARTVSNLKVDQ